MDNGQQRNTNEPAHEQRRAIDPDTAWTAGALSSGPAAPMKDVNEEMGADFAYGLPLSERRRETDEPLEARERDEPVVARESGGAVEAREAGGALGWVSLIFALASLFIWPVLLGATAAVLGFVAYRQGAKGLGSWSIGIGLASMVLYLLIAPFYQALT
jgi:hypothetical protein